MAITKTIRTLPTPPTRSDPANFDERADNFLGELPGFGEDLNEYASQCNQTQAEINQARDDAFTARDTAQQYRDQAYTHKENAYKWAQEAEDTQVDDGEHQGYSAYHYKEKARKWAVAPEDSQVTDGHHTGYSAFHYAEKARKYFQYGGLGNFKGVWDSTTTYSFGDYVFYKDAFWVSMTDNNTGNEPNDNSTYWKQTSDEAIWLVYAMWEAFSVLTQKPWPYGIPYLDENGYITPFIDAEWLHGEITNWWTPKFSNIDSFSFTANTVYQAQEDVILMLTVGSSDVTFSIGSSNPPDQNITLKANNTVTLFVPKDFYVQFSADTTATILTKEAENAFI